MTKVFPERFSAALEGSYLEIEDIAKSLNTSKQTVTAWLNGDSLPSLPYFATLCKKSSISADYLLGFSAEVSLTQYESFKLQYEISERLKRLTPESIELVYSIIRHISVADDSLLLFDSFYLDSIHPDAQKLKAARLSQASTTSLLSELDPDLKAKAEGYLEGIREAQRDRNSHSVQEA